MSLYIDSSALLKRYVDEPDSDAANALLASDPSLLTARHTIVEVRRNLARLLDERDAAAARTAFLADIAAFGIVELDIRQAQAARTLGPDGRPGLNTKILGARTPPAPSGYGAVRPEPRTGSVSRARARARRP